MPTRIQRSAKVSYTVEQMFALVNDVEAYPEFLPHCRSARVLEQGERHIKARVELAKGALHKSFTTLNRLEAPSRIEMKLVDGPFRRLHGAWQFTDLGGGRTRVMLDLEFEFSNRLVALALGPIFNQLANSLVDAFVGRARKIHGVVGHG
jgi:ribosome-associated toxin RatA of RatAB toxin-antitoxin module